MSLYRYVFILIFVFICLGVTAQENKYLQYQKILLEPDDSIKSLRLINYAERISDSLKDFGLATLIFEKANSVLSKHNYKTLNIALYNKWGFALYLNGQYKEADDLYVKALSYKILGDDKPLKAKILQRAGSNLNKIGSFKRAILYFNESLSLYTELNDEKAKAKVYMNMAVLFITTKNYVQAKSLSEKAKEIYLKNNLIEDYVQTTLNEGSVEFSLEHFSNAKVIFLQSLNLMKDIKSEKSNQRLTEIYFHLGFTYSELKKYDSCFYYLDKGKKIIDASKLTADHSGYYYYVIGRCYLRKGDTKKAIQCYKMASKYSNGSERQKFIYTNIAEIYSSVGQYDTALIYKNLSLKLLDSVYTSEIKEQAAFENKRIELVENDYKNQLKSAEQKQFLNNLEKRNYLLISLIVLLIAFVALFYLYFRQYRLKIKKEHLQSELDFLRAQLNPHFLFNSINNIYGLLDENKEKASEILLKFSDLMRYQLYDCNVSFINLEKELQFIDNFIVFEKLRYSDRIDVQYNYLNLESNTLIIAPLILQPFIENAFKHTPKSGKPQSFIHINISLNDTGFFMEVTNTLNLNKKSLLPGGIGLENVKKRLHLLYQNKYELNTITTENTYKITLKLILSKG